jgi:hypothetical protein
MDARNACAQQQRGMTVLSARLIPRRLRSHVYRAIVDFA